jgi:molecular chaperone DnaK (HSP70)
MEKLGEEFKTKYGSDPRKSDRARIRMLEAIEKARCMLSAVPDAVINIEYLMED